MISSPGNVAVSSGFPVIVPGLSVKELTASRLATFIRLRMIYKQVAWSSTTTLSVSPLDLCTYPKNSVFISDGQSPDTRVPFPKNADYNYD
jgi:hypothetical protein